MTGRLPGKAKIVGNKGAPAGLATKILYDRQQFFLIVAQLCRKIILIDQPVRKLCHHLEVAMVHCSGSNAVPVEHAECCLQAKVMAVLEVELLSKKLRPGTIGPDIILINSGHRDGHRSAARGSTI